MVKGKEEGTAISKERTSPVSTEGQSDNPKSPSLSVKRKDENVEFAGRFPEPSPEIVEYILRTLPDTVRLIGLISLFKCYIEFGVKTGGDLYNKYGGTSQGKTFVDRRLMAFGGGAVLLAFLTHGTLSGDGLKELFRETVAPFLRSSTPIERVPENQELIKALEEETEKVLSKTVYLKETLSGEFIQVPEEEVWDLFCNWCDKLDALLSQGKVQIDFAGFKSLPRDEQIRLTEEYDRLPVEWKNMVIERCPHLYPKMIQFDNLLSDLEWKEFNEKQGSSYPQQEGLPRKVRYTQTELGDLPSTTNPKVTVREYYQQRGEGPSPGHSYDYFSTEYASSHFEKNLLDEARRHLEVSRNEFRVVVSPESAQRTLVDKAWAKVKKAQQEYDKVVKEAESSALNLEPTGIGSLTLSEPFESTDKSLYRSVGSSSNQQGNIFPEGSGAQNQVVPRDRFSGESDYSPDNSPSLGARFRDSHNPNSPLEETLKLDRYTVWIGSGSCAFVLFHTIRIAWIILRKLDYTQELVKKMTDKGWPKFLFVWISHPEPGPVGGKPLFTLLVGILLGNIIVLYILMRIMYLVA